MYPLYPSLGSIQVPGCEVNSQGVFWNTHTTFFFGCSVRTSLSLTYYSSSNFHLPCRRAPPRFLTHHTHPPSELALIERIHLGPGKQRINISCPRRLEEDSTSASLHYFTGSDSHLSDTPSDHLPALYRSRRQASTHMTTFTLEPTPAAAAALASAPAPWPTRWARTTG